MTTPGRPEGRRTPRRHPPVDLGPQGAELIRELLLVQDACGLRPSVRPPDPSHHVADRVGELRRPPLRAQPSRQDAGARGRAPGQSARIHELRPAIGSSEPRRQQQSTPIKAPPRIEVPGSRRMTVRALRACLNFLLAPTEVKGDAQAASFAAGIDSSFSRQLRMGLRVLIFGGGIIACWATLVPLSAAVMVSGTLVVESNLKKVQHPNGGVIARILVHDGMHVKEGDLLASLDDTQVRAGLQIVTDQLNQIRMRIARLVAERDGSTDLQTPGDLASGTEAVFESEKTLFKARATARQSQKDLLRGRIGQLGEEIEGLEAQLKSKADQHDLILQELQGVRTLYEKQLVPLARLSALQREAASLDGERGQLSFAVAESKSKISEAELQIARIDQDFRADVMKDLRESQDKEAELTERKVAATDQLSRIDIRAPTSGVIHQLSVHTVGGVVTTGEVMMEIVPDSDDLQIEAHVPTNDIDQVHHGQTASLHFSAFNQRTTPQLLGKVSYVSADTSRDQHTNATYYTVRISLEESERRRMGGLQLVSGMPVEVFLQTGSRTMMSYLLKPITEQLQRAFKER